MRLVSLVRLLSCSMGGALGLLLAATAPFGPDDVTAIMGPGPVTPEAAAPVDPDDPACVDSQGCVGRYLWSVYQRTPKVEAGGADFTWKDADAAEKAGMSLMDYVIGGMDPGFRVTLFRALRMLDLAGFRPGIMCGFRDDYRQSITGGRMKAQNDRSFHGGSFRGGYGHGLAADIVSLRGRTVAERSDATDRMWKWVDSHEKELGIGRPYRDRDPPHVAPIDGEEYAAHRLPPNAHGAAGAKTRRPLVAPADRGMPNRTGAAPPPAKAPAKSEPGPRGVAKAPSCCPRELNHPTCSTLSAARHR
jgi:hypothetical protein